MVGSVQHTAPKNPHTFTLDIEKWNGLEPPVLRATGQKRQARHRKTQQSFDECLDRLLGRQHFGWRRLGRTEKLTEESSFGKPLMLQDVHYRAGSWVRPIGEVVARKLTPDRRDLVRLAGVDIECMLKSRQSSAWDGRFRDGGLILHAITPPAGFRAASGPGYGSWPSSPRNSQ